MALVCSLPCLSTVKGAPVTPYLKDFTVNPYFGPVDPSVFGIQDVASRILRSYLTKVPDDFHSNYFLVEPRVIRAAFLAYGVWFQVGTREYPDYPSECFALFFKDFYNGTRFSGVIIYRFPPAVHRPLGEQATGASQA
jgi:hypothetical protein